MGDELMVECGSADSFGRRSVTATCGRAEHRDRFNTDDAFHRQQFAEATLTKFQWANTGDMLAQIDELVVRESAARDAEPNCDGWQPCVQNLADVPASRVEWLWPGRIALGAVTMLAGDPGLGKSFVTLDIAARVSRGAPWPEQSSRHSSCATGESLSAVRAQAADVPPGATTTSTPASVVLISAEDDLSKTIRPRLEALGAHLRRVESLHAIQGRDERGSFTRPFDLSRDLPHLTSVVERLGDCRLVVIDPISAFLGRARENANAEVRRLLAPLAELAAERNLAVLVVSHLRKEEGGAIYRTMGSVAFVAAARASWLVVRDSQHPSRRLLLPVKNNLAEDVGGLAYTIEPLGPNRAPVVCWLAEPVSVRVETILNATRPAPHRPDIERQQAAAWLHEFLADGPRTSQEVREAAEANGFTYGTLRRAFRAIDGRAVKGTGRHSGWSWQLSAPAAKDVQKSDPLLLRTLSPHDALAPNSLETSCGQDLNGKTL